MNEQGTLFDKPGTTDCLRCGAQCRISGPGGRKAKMLRRSQGPGLCVNCAVHDWLRNTYPPNILLAQSGPRVLLLEHIQQQFTEIMRISFADAKPDEIDWQRIVDNWELPFLNKLKPSPMNPVNQKELDEIASGERKDFSNCIPDGPTVCNPPSTITSFEQLNELKPGLGDQLKNCLRTEDE